MEIEFSSRVLHIYIQFLFKFHFWHGSIIIYKTGKSALVWTERNLYILYCHLKENIWRRIFGVKWKNKISRVYNFWNMFESSYLCNVECVLHTRKHWNVERWTIYFIKCLGTCTSTRIYTILYTLMNAITFVNTF